MICVGHAINSHLKYRILEKDENIILGTVFCEMGEIYWKHENGFNSRKMIHKKHP